MSTSDVVIRVEGLGKKYSLHHEQSERTTALRDVVARQAAQEHATSEEEFWALKDVSFEIRRGERVGIRALVASLLATPRRLIHTPLTQHTLTTHPT